MLIWIFVSLRMAYPRCFFNINFVSSPKKKREESDLWHNLWKEINDTISG